MADKPHNPFHLWNELKQRKVVRVITVYTASAFAFLQAADMIFTRIGFPSWTTTLVMILLACGLVISIIFSWIYDITPEGIKKTEEIESEKSGRSMTNEAKPAFDKLPSANPEDNRLVNENRLYAEKIKLYKKKERLISLGSLFVIIAVIILFLFTGSSTIPFSKRDWIAISDFENLTENSLFDKSLYTAFSLTINQSRHINVLPRNKMVETLTRMKIQDPGFLDENVVREIAVREGINIFVSPSISEVGTKYVITAKIIEAKTGNLLKSQVLNAESKDDILYRLDDLSKRVRRDLGESRYNIALQDKPLSKVTTSSLEALKQYSLGIESHWKLDFKGAKTYYENALRIDTGFIAAKASLGNILLEHFNNDKGKELLRNAVRSIDNLTDKEKYSILSFYYINVEKKLKGGIENTRILSELYPDDATYQNNLGYYLLLDGQIEDALKAYKTAIRLDPTQALTYSGIIRIYMENKGDVDSVIVWSKKMIADNPRNAWGYLNLGSAYVCLDSLDNSIEFFMKAREMDPFNQLNLFRLAHSYRLNGQYPEAIRILERITEINKYEISVNYQLGVTYQLMGKLEEARKYFNLYEQKVNKIWLKQYPDMPQTYSVLSAVLARMGDTTASKQMLEKAISVDSTIHLNCAEVYCAQEKYAEAINQIEKALGNGYRFLYWLKADPDFHQLQNELHFRELLDKYFN